jgi:DNA-binding transcriptional MerR regulator
MLNRTHYKRLGNDNKYYLTQTLHWYSQEILLSDTVGLTEPNVSLGRPGVLFIDGERIEYFLLFADRVGQLRRGTLGTGVKNNYESGTEVFDQSAFQTVPYKEREIEKKYFSIGEVADMFKVAASLIRYWEGEFDIIRPKKDKKGNRRYTQDDIQKIRYVYHLVKEKGYTLQGAQEVIAAGKKQGFDKVAAVQKLQEIKDFLINLKHELHSRSNT